MHLPDSYSTMNGRTAMQQCRRRVVPAACISLCAERLQVFVWNLREKAASTAHRNMKYHCTESMQITCTDELHEPHTGVLQETYEEGLSVAVQKSRSKRQQSVSVPNHPVIPDAERYTLKRHLRSTNCCRAPFAPRRSVCNEP